MTNQCVHSVLCTAVQPSRKMVQRSQTPFLSHVFCSRTDLEFRYVFPVSSYLGREATPGGSPSGPCLVQVTCDPYILTFWSTVNLRVDSALTIDPGQDGVI